MVATAEAGVALPMPSVKLSVTLLASVSARAPPADTRPLVVRFWAFLTVRLPPADSACSVPIRLPEVSEMSPVALPVRVAALTTPSPPSLMEATCNVSVAPRALRLSPLTPRLTWPAVIAMALPPLLITPAVAPAPSVRALVPSDSAMVPLELIVCSTVRSTLSVMLRRPVVAARVSMVPMALAPPSFTTWAEPVRVPAVMMPTLPSSSVPDEVNVTVWPEALMAAPVGVRSALRAVIEIAPPAARVPWVVPLPSVRSLAPSARVIPVVAVTVFSTVSALLPVKDSAPVTA